MRNGTYWYDHLDYANEELNSLIEILNDENASEREILLTKKLAWAEFCNLFWMLQKSLRYIMLEQGCIIERNSPKAIFKQLYDRNYITEEEFKI